MYDVKCTVKSVKGECAAGYKVGDHFFIKDMAMIEAGAWMWSGVETVTASTLSSTSAQSV